MKKLFFLFSIFTIVLSCSSDETSTPVTPPPAPIVKYTITLSAGEGGTVSTTGGEYEAGQTVSVTATPQGEYIFKDWSDGNTNATRTITVSSNNTLTANFEKRKYPLTLNIEGEGEVLEEIVNAGRTTDYDSGTTVKLTAVPAEGWEFAGWTGAIESTELEVQLLVSEAKSISTLFVKKNLFNEKDYYVDFIRVTQPSILGHNGNTKNHETEFYKVDKIGWLGLTVEETHNGGRYGEDDKPPGVFWVTPKLVMKRDLNNDGLEDMIFHMDYGPHYIESQQTGITLFALINLGDGTFEYTQEFFDSGLERTPIGSYRTRVADINMDGIDDILLGMRAGPVFNADGSVDGGPANPMMAISSSSNSFVDKSENLNGIFEGSVSQEDDRNQNGIVDYLSDRAYGLGDFDNDGDTDYFMSEKIFLNDGNGVFNVSPKQLNPSMIPKNIVINSNTYEAHSNDFNNDGYDDIVIIPNAEYIIEKGGSGWIAMSNGSNDFSNWSKVSLPDAVYPNNSNMNSIKSFDYDKDGYNDLVIANTRRNPYYRGITVQLLKNNNGESFTDVTQSNIDDQSDFDKWRGEGIIHIEDINNDSQLDIIHLTGNTSDGPPNQHHGTNIYINDDGYFKIYDTENNLPFINWTQFEGYQSSINNPNLTDVFTLDRAWPVNINNDGKIDFIATDLEAYGADRLKKQTLVFYSIISK